MFLTTAMAARAQVFTQGFEEEQPADTTLVGWYQYINTQTGDVRELTSDDAHSGTQSLHFFNSADVAGNNWQRAIKFRNLPIEENTAYRLSFYLKGSNTYTVDGKSQRCSARFALMQGVENADAPFVATDGTSTYVSDISRFNEGDYEHYTGFFYYGTKAAEQAYYASQHPDAAPLEEKYFATLNVYNPGDFYIDDVQLVKTNIAGATFKNDYCRIDFGFDTNIKSLVEKYGEGGTLLLPNDCVTLTQNGEPQDVLSVELRSDGYMYIFLASSTMEDGDKVTIAFKNPSGDYQLKYQGAKVPNYELVPDFTEEAAWYDGGMSDDIFSWQYVTPSVKQADPEDGSFDLPLDTKHFTVVFNKDVEASALEATLGSQKLTVEPSEGYASSFTLTPTAALTAGEYTLTLDKVYPRVRLSDDVFGTYKFDLTFGSSAADPNDTAYVVMKDSISETVTNSQQGEGFIPYGWNIYSANNKLEQGSKAGSGPRPFKFADGGDFVGGLYIRTTDPDNGWAEYGSTEGYELPLESGKKYQISYNVAAWKNAPYVKFELIDANGTSVVTRIDAAKPNLNGSKNAIVGSTAVSFTYRPTDNGNYIMKWSPVANADGGGGAWLEVILGNVKVTYIPNQSGIVEKKLLATALDNAKTVLANNSAVRYAGPDQTALQTAIAKYDGQSSTAPSWYRNAAAELDAAAKAMQEHRTLCDTYDPLVSKAQGVLDGVEDKYKAYKQYDGHVAYDELLATINTYSGQVLTDNDSLKTAINTLNESMRYMATAKRVVDALTQSIQSGYNTLKMLTTPSAALTASVNSVLTDDATVKQAVRDELTTALYRALSDPANTVFSEKLDTTTLETYVDSLDMSVFLENPEFYFLCNPDGSNSSEATVNLDNVAQTLPGWTMTAGTGWSEAISYHYPWAWFADKDTWKYTTVNKSNPAANGSVADWGREMTLTQHVTGLPAGTYELVLGVGDRNSDNESAPKCFVKYTTAAGTDSVAVKIIPGSNDAVDGDAATIIKNLVITDGNLDLAVINQQEGRPLVNYVRLYMKGAADEFNYTTGIKTVDNSDANVVKTAFYGVDGRQLNSPTKGVVIVKQTLSNGKTRTSKVVVR